MMKTVQGQQQLTSHCVRVHRLMWQFFLRNCHTATCGSFPFDATCLFHIQYLNHLLLAKKFVFHYNNAVCRYIQTSVADVSADSYPKLINRTSPIVRLRTFQQNPRDIKSCNNDSSLTHTHEPNQN